MQTCVDYGAKYGKFEVASEMVKRKTVSRKAAALASEVKAQLVG